MHIASLELAEAAVVEKLARLGTGLEKTVSSEEGFWIPARNRQKRHVS
jgi:hypothetical protein